MRNLVDTNILSEIRKGARANRGVQRWSGENDNALNAISVVTVGEIRRGIEDLRRRDLDQALVLERWLQGLHQTFKGQIFDITASIADQSKMKREATQATSG